MSRLLQLLLPSILVLAVLAGCTHNEHRAAAEAAYYEAQAKSAQSLNAPIVELVAREGQDITLSGVERFAVYSPKDESDARIAQYRGEPSPWISIFSELRKTVLGGGAMYFGAEVLDTALRNAGGNTTVGGNLGDTRGDVVDVGGNYGDTDNSVDVGGNYGDTRGDEIVVGRDQIGRDQRVGDDISDSCVGPNCRNDSGGPIDNSDNSSGDGGDP